MLINHHTADGTNREYRIIAPKGLGRKPKAEQAAAMARIAKRHLLDPTCGRGSLACTVTMNGEQVTVNGYEVRG